MKITSDCFSESSKKSRKLALKVREKNKVVPRYNRPLVASFLLEEFMNTEYECRFLEIDKEKLIKKARKP